MGGYYLLQQIWLQISRRLGRIHKKANSKEQKLATGERGRGVTYCGKSGGWLAADWDAHDKKHKRKKKHKLTILRQFWRQIRRRPGCDARTKKKHAKKTRKLTTLGDTTYCGKSGCRLAAGWGACGDDEDDDDDG